MQKAGETNDCLSYTVTGMEIKKTEQEYKSLQLFGAIRRKNAQKSGSNWRGRAETERE